MQQKIKEGVVVSLFAIVAAIPVASDAYSHTYSYLQRSYTQSPYIYRSVSYPSASSRTRQYTHTPNYDAFSRLNARPSLSLETPGTFNSSRYARSISPSVNISAMRVGDSIYYSGSGISGNSFTVGNTTYFNLNNRSFSCYWLGGTYRCN